MSNKKIDKFSVTKELLKTKSGFSVETTRITANNPKNLITLEEIKKLVDVMKNKGKDVKKLKIVGMNQMRMMTIKSEGLDIIPDDGGDYYWGNGSQESKLSHFYQVAIIEKINNKNKK